VGDVKPKVTARRRARAILGIPAYRRLALLFGGGYLLLFMIAMRDLTPGGEGFSILTVPWARMLERTGTLTFEPVVQVMIPGWTLLVSPLNLAMGGILAGLASLNLVVTWIAVRHPRACGFNRSSGILASLPALLAGSACCAPVPMLLLGLQIPSLMMPVFQVLIPLSAVLLLVTLKLLLDRTELELLTSPEGSGDAPAPDREPLRRGVSSHF